MKKVFFIAISIVLFFTNCANEFNAVYKSSDTNYRYEYAKECFVNGKYTRAIIQKDNMQSLRAIILVKVCT